MALLETCGVASFASTSFSTGAFATNAWDFGETQPEPEQARGPYIETRIDKTHERILREDDEMLAIIMAFMETMK